MALQVVQRVLVQSSGSVASVVTSGITTTSGNLLVALPISFGNHIGATPITDSNGNTWSSAIATFGNSTFGAMHYVPNCTGGAAHTFTFTASTNGLLLLIVYEISGAALSSVLGSTSTSTTNTTSHNSGNITSGSSFPEIFVGMLGLSGSDTCSLPLSPTAGTDWSGLSGRRAGANVGGISAFRIVDVNVTDGYQVNRTGATSQAEAIMVAGFKAATAGGGGGGYLLVP